MIVIDASVAIKWFVAGEPHQNESFAVLNDIAAHPQNYAVPELFFNEMLAVLCKTTDATESIVISALQDLQNLGFYRVGNGNTLLALAVSLAQGLRISGYDAIYLATAHSLDGYWLTADARASKRINDPKRVRLLGTGTQ